MTETVLAAEGGIEVGVHPEATFFGLTFNVDTVISTLVAAAIVVGFSLYLRAKTTAGVPTGVQLMFETVTDQVERQVEENVGIRTAPFVVPLALALFFFILIANWMSLIPHAFDEYLKPPTADVNLTFALAFFVIILIHVTGFVKRGTGYFRHFLGPIPVMAPIEILQEIIRPFSLSLRLFGNIFAGTVMVSIIALMPEFLYWLPTSLWKLFELAIGLIQAIIFAVLTIVYFSNVSPEEEGAH